MKTSELIGPALDWAVAKCMWPGRNATWILIVLNADDGGKSDKYKPSTNWSQGGPIIEQEKMTVGTIDGDYVGWTGWMRNDDGKYFACGPTPLIAAMRCFVASKLGDDVEIPEELK